jgi:hypothetical protein
MQYCRDVFLQPAVFWSRVSDCSHRQGAHVAESIANIFMAGRKAYIRLSGIPEPPNEAARLVDEWIAFVSQGGRDTSAEAPWNIRRREWLERKARGDLMDIGYEYDSRDGIRNGAISNLEADARSATAPRNRTRSPSVEIKEERRTPEESIRNDVSLLDLGSNKPEGYRERKRRRTRSPSERSTKRLADQATRDTTVSRPVDDQLQTPRIQAPFVLDSNPLKARSLTLHRHQAAQSSKLEGARQLVLSRRRTSMASAKFEWPPVKKRYWNTTPRLRASRPD